MELSVGLMLILSGTLNLSGMMRWIAETVTPLQSGQHSHPHEHGDYAHVHSDPHGHSPGNTAMLGRRLLNLLRKHLKPAAKKLSLSGVIGHLLRDSHAPMFGGVGTPIGTMQALLGHSGPEITREIHLHAIPTRPYHPCS
jgi:integrase